MLRSDAERIKINKILNNYLVYIVRYTLEILHRRGDGSWLPVTEPGPRGMLPALWLPDALPGRGNVTSTAAAGGG